jgi:hypothetical protein
MVFMANIEPIVDLAVSSSNHFKSEVTFDKK